MISSTGIFVVVELDSKTEKNFKQLPDHGLSLAIITLDFELAINDHIRKVARMSNHERELWCENTLVLELSQGFFSRNCKEHGDTALLQDYEEANLEYYEEHAALNEWESAKLQFKPWDSTYLQLNWSLFDAEVVWKRACRDATDVVEAKGKLHRTLPCIYESADMESQDAMIDIAEWRFDKAEWRYNMVLKGCTKWDEEHPGYKTWNVQHIQLKMLLTDVENRWNEAQEEARSTESTTWANRIATSKAVKNATSLRSHAFDALHEWKTGHSNLNARYSERRELIACERS
ncbi:hypothetical protein LEN26_018889 [Aphanomyces euteiches]|nr:hypothetical protein LEN26_018889 [Aphanomyces euteiches]KAH9104046.1 hypothetical protein AeMF1_019761 [Aphanomyces euteiches]